MMCERLCVVLTMFLYALVLWGHTHTLLGLRSCVCVCVCVCRCLLQVVLTCHASAQESMFLFVLFSP